MKIVLASTSPYRKTLLKKLGISFECIAPEVDEKSLPGETAEQLVKRLSIAKASAIAEQQPDAIVIGSDQVAVIDNEILGKPGNYENAFRQLKNVLGKRVTFLTGLCVINSKTGTIHASIVPYHVVFRFLRDSQIENYLHREQPYNCAGSFKSEALGISLFERLEGDDPNALMGLPLIRLVAMLELEGIRVI